MSATPTPRPDLDSLEAQARDWACGDEEVQEVKVFPVSSEPNEAPRDA
jgi:hypothetical protein